MESLTTFQQFFKRQITKGGNDMREILFRGKHVGGFWCYGNLVVKKCGISIITPDDTPIGKYGRVDSSTVGQYTGLTDKNGVKIFEGDIVTINNGEEPFHVMFADFSWQLTNKKLRYYRHRPEPGNIYTVIGNIHDNPELIEG